MTESIEDKTDRLLTTGKVFVRWATPEHVCAVVRGDSSIYDVHLHGGRWSCPCPARTTCSHLRAVMLVTVPCGGTRGDHLARPAEMPITRTTKEKCNV